MKEIDELQLTTGIDVPIEGLGITLHQPRIKEIAMIGETPYFMALQIFLFDKKSVNIKEDVDSWTIFEQSLQQKIEGIADTRKFMQNFLQLFFLPKINFGPHSLLLSTPDGVTSVEPQDFEKLQHLIGVIGGKSLLSGSQAQYKPKNSKAAQIAEKMKKMQNKVAAMKSGGAKSGSGFLSKYIKTIALKTANSIEDIDNMTLYQLNSLYQYYICWEAYDIKVRSRLAGAKDDEELVHWTVDADRKENGGLDIGTI